MTNLSWRDYMRELLKMSNARTGCEMAEPYFCGVKSYYEKITPKIKVEFECAKPEVTFSKGSHGYIHSTISIDGTVDGVDCVLGVSFSSQEEQEKVFKKLIEAFGG